MNGTENDHLRKWTHIDIHLEKKVRFSLQCLSGLHRQPVEQPQNDLGKEVCEPFPFYMRDKHLWVRTFQVRHRRVDARKGGREGPYVQVFGAKAQRNKKKQQEFYWILWIS